jgi:hypothetical protein
VRILLLTATATAAAAWWAVSSGCSRGAGPAERSAVPFEGATEQHSGEAASRPGNPLRAGGAGDEGAEETSGTSLTPRALDAFIGYQARLLALQTTFLEELGAEDGGAAVVALRRHARAEEALRLEAGLTETEVEEIERLVSDVLSARARAGALGGRTGDPTSGDGGQWELDALSERLSTEQREELAQALESIRARQQEAAALGPERSRYGDAAVELVLGREEALWRNHELALSIFGRTGGPAHRPAARPRGPRSDAGSAPGSGG